MTIHTRKNTETKQVPVIEVFLAFAYAYVGQHYPYGSLHQNSARQESAH